MHAPFIVKAVSKIHPGKAEAYQPVAAEFCRLAEESEPRLLGFHIYVTEDRSSEVVVQIHPDAESMQYHLQVMGEKVRETFAYTDFERLEIYGQPNDDLTKWIARASEGIPFTLHPVHCPPERVVMDLDRSGARPGRSWTLWGRSRRGRNLDPVISKYLSRGAEI